MLILGLGKSRRFFRFSGINFWGGCRILPSWHWNLWKSPFHLSLLGFWWKKWGGEKKIIFKKNGGFGLVKKMSDLQGGIHLAVTIFFGKFAPYLQCVNIDVLVHLGFTCCLSCLWFVKNSVLLCPSWHTHILHQQSGCDKKTVQIDAIHKDQ